MPEKTRDVLWREAEDQVKMLTWLLSPEHREGEDPFYWLTVGKTIGNLERIMRQLSLDEAK